MLVSTPPRSPLLAWRSSSPRNRGIISSIISSSSGTSLLRAAAAASGNNAAAAAAGSTTALDPDWRTKAKPVAPGSSYPAKEHCSQCGLCDTYFVAHVKEACAFLGDGMSKAYTLEPSVHGRNRYVKESRKREKKRRGNSFFSSSHERPPGKKKISSNLSGDELQLGVTLDTFYARARPAVDGAQWTGVVTSIALAMLETKTVDAVVCVQSDPEDRLAPFPVVARTKHEILASRGVKPSLSPNLSVLATVEALGPEIKSLLFIGVGCQVQALRSVSKYLGLEKLFVLGTNCTDNGPREG